MVEFTSTNLEEWSAALAAYGERLEALGNPKLTGLDMFYRVELPKLLEGRQPDAYITREELIKIMNWKLSRGKWRCIVLHWRPLLLPAHIEVLHALVLFCSDVCVTEREEVGDGRAILTLIFLDSSGV